MEIEQAKILKDKLTTLHNVQRALGELRGHVSCAAYMNMEIHEENQKNNFMGILPLVSVEFKERYVKFLEDFEKELTDYINNL